MHAMAATQGHGRRCVASLLLLVGLVTSAGVARAQECNAHASDAEVERARSLFVDGSHDVEAYRWSDAIPKFEQSYALSCAPSALYNLAMALRALGRHHEARDAFDRLLADHEALDDERRRTAETYRQEEAARVAVLLLAGLDPDTHPELHFDGEDVGDEGERPIRIEADAGAHSLIARIPEHRPFVWEGRLGDGQHETLQVVFEALVNGGGDDWVLPLVLSLVGAAVAAGAGVLGWYLWEDAQVRPLTPNRLVTVGQ